MYNFNFHSPNTIDEAIKLFNASEEPKFIAGGMTLLASMKQRLIAPTDLIDLRNIKDLSEINCNEDIISIGSLCTHSYLSKNEIINNNIKNLAKLADGIGDPAVRQMGTIGGSIANSDPAADWPAAILALKSSIKTNNRIIQNKDLFTGMFETSLEENEIITSTQQAIHENNLFIEFHDSSLKVINTGIKNARITREIK